MRSRSLHAAWKAFGRFRSEAARVSEDGLKRHLALRAVEMALSPLAEGEATTPLVQAKLEMIEEISWSMRSDPESIRHWSASPCNWESEVRFLPRGRHLYGILRSAQPELRDLWFSQPEVIDYSCDLSASAPDGISDHEWARRRRTWLLLLEGERSPGVTVYAPGDAKFMLASEDDLVAYLPDPEVVARRLAEKEMDGSANGRGHIALRAAEVLRTMPAITPELIGRTGLGADRRGFGTTMMTR